MPDQLPYEIPKPDLWYRLDEAPGSSTAVDSSGYGRHAFYANTPHLGVRGLMRGNTAADFYYSESEYVVLGENLDLSGSQLTFEAFVRPFSYPNFIHTIMGIEDYAGSTNIALLRMGDAGLDRHYPQFVFSTTDGAIHRFPYQSPLTEGRRYLVVWTYDGFNIKFYVNGVWDAWWRWVDSSGQPITNPYLIQARGLFNISRSFGARYYNGVIDEVAVHRRVLPYAEIAAHYDQLAVGLAVGDGGSQGETPDPLTNANNEGEQYAMTGDPGLFVTNVLHEVIHTLGAVMWTAPNSNDTNHDSFAGHTHCHEDKDVMCSSDDDWAAANGSITILNCASGYEEWQVDCNHNDYWNPFGARSIMSWDGRSIWNIANSGFLTVVIPDPGLGGD